MCRVSPFGNLWIAGYLLLPTAFRSLSRPSSAPSAKAFPLCSYFLELRPLPRFRKACSLTFPENQHCICCSLSLFSFFAIYFRKWFEVAFIYCRSLSSPASQPFPFPFYAINQRIKVFTLTFFRFWTSKSFLFFVPLDNKNIFMFFSLV